jgi:hypothetical protein
LLISCVLVVTSCLTSGASADARPPQEITKYFAPQGQIVEYVELQFREYYLIAYIYWIKAAGILTTKIYWKSSLLKTTSPSPSGAARHNLLYSAKPKAPRRVKSFVVCCQTSRLTSR